MAMTAVAAASSSQVEDLTIMRAIQRSPLRRIQGEIRHANQAGTEEEKPPGDSKQADNEDYKPQSSKTQRRVSPRLYRPWALSPGAPSLHR